MLSAPAALVGCGAAGGYSSGKTNSYTKPYQAGLALLRGSPKLIELNYPFYGFSLARVDVYKS